jgi:ubiquinone/menaquinone biosynthesis C-methylase UbiE
MSSKAILEKRGLPARLVGLGSERARQRTQKEPESLFEQVPWLYAFCRENLFRDDTDRISRVFWPDGAPPSGTRLIELGCGPGFYSCGLARRHPQLSVIGADRSARQVAWARGRAQKLSLPNCRFERIDALHIPGSECLYDALLAARLFTVVAEREEALSEMHRVLRPNGRCLIAEPRDVFRASIPLAAMWLVARATRFGNGYREPRRAYVMEFSDFTRLCATQPWKSCEFWRDRRYQYALCEKA